MSFVSRFRLASLDSIKTVPSHLLFCALFLSVISGCTQRSQNIDIELPGGKKVTLEKSETLRVNLQTEPPTLDWHRAADTTSSTVIDNIMEGLVEFDLNDKELGLRPALAEKWESSDGARKWKFTLRHDVVWSDGQTFTAQNVADSWKRLLAKQTAAEYAYFLFGVKNAQAFNQGKVGWDQVGVRVLSPFELQVELEKPIGYFPSLLTHSSTYPIRIDVVEKFGDKWTDPANIVTLGPFTLKAWQHDKMLVFERNEKYFGAKAKVKFVAAYLIQEQATAINLFDSGKIDVVTELPSVELRKLRERKEFKQTGLLQIYYYGTNVKKPPMNNPLVRKAVSMAVDRQELVQMLGGGQIPLTSWIPPGMFGYEPKIGLGFDPVKAKELLQQAGFSDPSKVPKIEIQFNTNEDHQRIAENIQAQLKRNLGINVELKNSEWKVYLNTLKTDPPALYRFGWLADYPDPDNFLAVVAGFSDNNHTNWKNAKYDELISKGAGTVDKEERRKIYAEAQKILVEDDVPVIPFFASVTQMLISPRLENYPINVMNKRLYKGVSLK